MSARDVIANEFDSKRPDYDSADILLAALDAAGFAVVPRMPTEAMELRGDEDRSSAAAVWFNMISAAAKETP